MVYFQTKIPIWVYIGGPWHGKGWYIYGHLKYLTSTWYILRPFGTFCGYLACILPFWYVVPRKIWQPCKRVKLNWDPFTKNHSKYKRNALTCIQGSKRLGKIIINLSPFEIYIATKSNNSSLVSLIATKSLKSRFIM
jgi:hypothetical protein